MAITKSISYKGLQAENAYFKIEGFRVKEMDRRKYIDVTVEEKLYVIRMDLRMYVDATKEFMLDLPESLETVTTRRDVQEAEVTLSKCYEYLLTTEEFSNAVGV